MTFRTRLVPLLLLCWAVAGYDAGTYSAVPTGRVLLDAGCGLLAALTATALTFAARQAS